MIIGIIDFPGVQKIKFWLLYPILIAALRFRRKKSDYLLQGITRSWLQWGADHIDKNMIGWILGFSRLIYFAT